MAQNAVTTPVAASITPIPLLAATSGRIVQSGSPNPGRRGCSIYYDGAAILYLLADDGSDPPSSTNYTVKMGAGYYTFWEPTDPDFQGKVTGIWDSAVGTAMATEYG